MTDLQETNQAEDGVMQGGKAEATGGLNPEPLIWNRYDFILSAHTADHVTVGNKGRIICTTHGQKLHQQVERVKHKEWSKRRKSRRKMKRGRKRRSRRKRRGSVSLCI